MITCPRCRAQIESAVDHIAHCPVVRLAFDPSYWPWRENDGHGQGGRRRPNRGCVDCGSAHVAYRYRCRTCAAAEGRLRRAGRRIRHGLP